MTFAFPGNEGGRSAAIDAGEAGGSAGVPAEGLAVTDERDDYADLDLPPPRSWLKEDILPTLVGGGIIGAIFFVGLVIAFVWFFRYLD